MNLADETGFQLYIFSGILKGGGEAITPLTSQTIRPRLQWYRFSFPYAHIGQKSEEVQLCIVLYNTSDPDHYALNTLLLFSVTSLRKCIILQKHYFL